MTMAAAAKLRRDRTSFPGSLSEKNQVVIYSNVVETEGINCSRFCFPLKFLLREENWHVGLPGKLFRKTRPKKKAQR